MITESQTKLASLGKKAVVSYRKVQSLTLVMILKGRNM